MTSKKISRYGRLGKRVKYALGHVTVFVLGRNRGAGRKLRFTIDPVKMEIDKPEFVLSLYGVYRDYIKHEDALVNFRTTWFIVFQGFLFAAFSTGLQKAMDTCTKPEGIVHLSRVLHIFLLFTPIVAFLMCGASFISILSAHRATHTVRARGALHATIFNSFGLPGLTGGGRSELALAGTIVSLFFPPLVSLFWLMQFFSIVFGKNIMCG